MNKTKLLTALLALGICNKTMPTTDLMNSLKDIGKKYPVLTTATGLTMLYSAAYGYTHFMPHAQTPAQLIQHGPSDAHEHFLYVHGLGETHEQGFWYTKGKTTKPTLIDGQLFTYDFPDATKRCWRVNITQTSLGQHNEIMKLKDAYEQTLTTLDQQSPDTQKNIVLMGMSRGATTILNFLGRHNPTRVKAAIVESPFDATKTVVENLLKRFHLANIPGVATLGHWLMSAIFWQHSVKGECARDAIQNIDPTIPLLLVCSKEDALVPAHSTITLYQALKSAGHTKVHLFVADKGSHGRIIRGEQARDYQAIVNAFYKQYGMSHDPLLAEEGQLLFDQSQADIMIQ